MQNRRDRISVVTQHDNFNRTPYKIVTVDNFQLNMINEIGKTLFITREEAEKMLVKSDDADI